MLINAVISATRIKIVPKVKFVVNSFCELIEYKVSSGKNLHWDFRFNNYRLRLNLRNHHENPSHSCFAKLKVVD
ncbi:44686_t:CDS:2 [Gigaspora margarita]|uniref:44686_t:CDS:1 n=1 Tax=Gigaspora margarita TaxID=4874 RepID=A0ABN7V3L2_GIGMA|nr:44686_t:CDS:2 [Gigaspora margarita]